MGREYKTSETREERRGGVTVTEVSSRLADD